MNIENSTSNAQRRTRTCSVLCGVAFVTVFLGCAREREPARQTWQVMGTYAAVAVPESEKPRLDEYTGAARDVFDELNGSLSIYRTNSEISALNRAAGQSFAPVSPGTREVLEISLDYARKSGGSFDITVAPLMKLWGFRGASPAVVPDKAALEDTLRRVGYSHLVLSNGAAFLDTAGMSVDLGGIAKGYAVDVCWEKLVDLDARNFMVDLGGNIRCKGSAEPGKPWRIGVRNPFDRERLVGVIELADGMAVATSGNYEQYVTIGSERYTHIMDPRTGWPVRGMAAVTVIGATAVETDAMSTALFVMGIEKGVALLAGMKDCHAIFIPDEQPISIRVTPGLMRHFKPLPEFEPCVRQETF